MPIDPRLNCAAEICCSPPPPTSPGLRAVNQPAHQARVAILVDLGVPEEMAHKVSAEMDARGIVFLSAELAVAIRNIAFPEDSKKAPEPFFPAERSGSL